MSYHPFADVGLLLPANTLVVAGPPAVKICESPNCQCGDHEHGRWIRQADGRIAARFRPHELDLVLRLIESIPGLAQEHLAAARRPPAPRAIPPEPPAPPEPPEEPRPDALEVGEMVGRTGQLVLM